MLICNQLYAPHVSPRVRWWKAIFLTGSAVLSQKKRFVCYGIKEGILKRFFSATFWKWTLPNESRMKSEWLLKLFMTYSFDDEPSKFRDSLSFPVSINPTTRHLLLIVPIRSSPSSFQNYFVTYERFVQWLDWLQDQNDTRWTNKKGTVGAVAVDASGRSLFSGVASLTWIVTQGKQQAYTHYFL